MLVKRILFVILITVAPALGVLPAEPAFADPVITATFDTTVAHPGDTVTAKVIFTNPETVDVTFTYLSANSTYDTMKDGTKYEVTSCTGGVTSCNHSTAPIPPGATRTMVQTYKIAPDSPCGEGIDLALFYYSYRESTAGASAVYEYAPIISAEIHHGR